MNLFINLNFIQEIPCSKQVRDLNLDCSSTQIHNHLVCKRTLRHLTVTVVSFGLKIVICYIIIPFFHVFLF